MKLARLCGFLAVLCGALVHLSAADTVLLLHGLGRGPRSLAKLERTLTAEGYRVINLRYASRSAAIHDLAAEALGPVFAAPRLAGERVHIVTHSLGGVLVRQYLHDHGTPINLGRVVMLAPPNQGSEVADKLARWSVYGWLNGPAGLDLGTAMEQTPNALGPLPAGVEVGVIAGGRSLNPFFSAIIPGPDDGKVAVERTHVAGEADHAIVPYSHTWLMNRTETERLVCRFLSAGNFGPRLAVDTKKPHPAGMRQKRF